jgi:hypothetical protein
MPVHVISKPRLYSRISVTVNADVEHTEGDTLLLAEIRSLKVKDLKEALSKLNLSTTDVLENKGRLLRLPPHKPTQVIL